MNLDDLKKGTDAETRTVCWSGHEADVRIRRVSYGQILDTLQRDDAGREVALLAACVELDDGETLTEAQARDLTPELAGALSALVVDVNRLGDEADADPKNA